MPVKSYAELHKRLKDLIIRGAKVADATVRTPEAQIHGWINEAQLCLLLLEDKMPTLLADFRRIRPSFEFKVNEDEEADSSNSAYRPSWIDQRTGQMDGADVLLDFRFDLLEQANGILKLAATKLELDGYSFAEGEICPESSGATGNPPDEKPVAPLNPTPGSTPKSKGFDATVLRNARVALAVTQEQAAEWFKVPERSYKRWESGWEKGKQHGMHLSNYARFLVFVKWSQEHTGLPPNDTQMSPSADTEKAP